MQGTTVNEDIPNRENESVSTLSAQEPLTDGHEDTTSPGRDPPHAFGTTVQSIGKSTTNPIYVTLHAAA